MTPFQQLYLGLGASKKTYLDDVYKTFLYRGNNSSRTLNVGIDFTTDGGATFIKNRSSGESWAIFDTVRGNGKLLHFNSTTTQSESFARHNNFSTTGFDVGAETETNENNSDIASFNLKKAKGFFDVVTYTGNGSNRTIAHSLGCIPGFIAVKNLSSAENWRVYHRSIGAEKHLILNTDNVSVDSDLIFNDTEPTASVFSLGTEDSVNKNGDNYVAYVFAGGESTAATARSVDFSGSSQALSVGSSDDFHFTGDWTAEGYFYVDAHSNYQALFGHSAYSPGSAGGTSLYFGSDGVLLFYAHGGTKITGPVIKLKQWTHIAVTRSGSTVTLYIDGKNVGSYTESNDFGASDNKFWSVGCANNGSSNVDFFNGKISNIRVVKGTAVYTSSFRVPTKPLTNITNTKLLCCNNSSTTGSTVTPATITAVGSPTEKTDSPFDDPSAFTFGDSKEGIIKCGSYQGNGSATGPEIFLGWEPQWIIIKNVDSASKNWQMIDSMRGILTDQDDNILMVNHPDAESAAGRVDLTSTGFKLNNSNVHFNSTDETYVYMAVRRPDGYVGKPVETATSVFAMDTGNSSSSIPNFDSAFPVDLALYRQPGGTEDWWTATRLTGTDFLRANDTNNKGTNTHNTWDSNVGWGKSGMTTSYQSWMWKRHAGFDVTTWVGEGGNRQIPHSLNKVPEMIWVKRRDDPADWAVYHKGLNGGTNPANYHLHLNTTAAEDASSTMWNDSAPTATYFNIGSNSRVNSNGTHTRYVGMLFASVDGISKVGYYTGNGGSSTQTITLGFAPRFILIKRTDTTTEHWLVLDTVRGWVSGGDSKFIYLQSSAAQGTLATSTQGVTPTSTGVEISGTSSVVNTNTGNYIYYAHA